MVLCAEEEKYSEDKRKVEPDGDAGLAMPVCGDRGGLKNRKDGGSQG
jgi:hypothetical protein